MTGTEGGLLAVLLASLAGSLHCAGMCGPFVAGATAGGGSGTAGRPVSAWRLQAAYALGRLSTYLLLGAVAGLLGRALDLAGEAVGVARLAAVAAALVMVLGGAVGLLRHLGWWPKRASRPHRAAGLVWRLSGWLRRADGLSPVTRAYAVGLLTTWLPCGWLYAFVAMAAGSGSLWRAEAVMVAFWLGTVPALLSVGLASALGGARLRRHAPLVLSVALLGLGVWGLARRGAVLLQPPADGAAVAASCHHQGGH